MVCDAYIIYCVGMASSVQFVYIYRIYILLLSMKVKFRVTGCIWSKHWCRISNWICVVYDTHISQLVMRNSISLAFDSPEGLAWSCIKNELLIVPARQHICMNAAYYRPRDKWAMAPCVNNRRSAKDTGSQPVLLTGGSSRLKQ